MVKPCGANISRAILATRKPDRAIGRECPRGKPKAAFSDAPALLSAAFIFLSFCFSCAYPADKTAAEIPLFSHPSGIYDGPFDLVLSAEEGSTIYYTLDGSDPDPARVDAPVLDPATHAQTFAYSGPIRVDAGTIPLMYSLIPTTDYSGPPTFGAGEWKEPTGDLPAGAAIKAAAYGPGGSVAKEGSRFYYLIDGAGTMPVVSIIGPADGFFSVERGIFCPIPPPGASIQNFYLPGFVGERRVDFGWFDPSSGASAEAAAGVRVGGASRGVPNRTLALYFRSEYGGSGIPGRFLYEDPAKDIHRLTLRSGGSNWYTSFLNDQVANNLCGGLDLERHSSRSALLFLNGEFWGIIQTTDKIDSFRYLQEKFGFPDGDEAAIDIIERFDGSASLGNNARYKESLAFVESAALSGGISDEELDEIDREHFDTDQLATYVAFEIFAANMDWPMSNMFFWRNGAAGREEFGAFRTLVHDMDLSIGNDVNFKPSYEKNMFDVIDRYESSDPYGGVACVHGADLGWPWGRATYFFRALMTNRGFLDRLVARACLLACTEFGTETAGEAAKREIELIRPWVAHHIDRWGYPESVEAWELEAGKIPDFLRRRAAVVVDQAAGFYSAKASAIPALIGVSIGMEPPGAGSVSIAGIEKNGVVSFSLPSGLPLRLEALPGDGCVFDGWSDGVAEATRAVASSEDIDLVARFRK